ncbi:MAG: hypothetical protein KJ592_04480 [Nanoarchaeota archaeon]|nr:hypothetical protein [Nanoarchaeota archaeon]
MGIFGNTRDARIKELEAIVSQKNRQIYDKQTEIDGMYEEAKTLLEDYPFKTAQSFMERPELMTDDPYLFVGRKGTVIGYTPALTKILEINESAIGRNYFEIFGTQQEGSEIRDQIKRYFSSPEEKKVSYEITINDKKRKVIITKQKPVYSHKVDLSILGRERPREIISFIPIKIEAPGFFSRSKDPELLEIIGVDMRTIYHELATIYKCTGLAELSDGEALALYREKVASKKKSKSKKD